MRDHTQNPTFIGDSIENLKNSFHLNNFVYRGQYRILLAICMQCFVRFAIESVAQVKWFWVWFRVDLLHGAAVCVLWASNNSFSVFTDMMRHFCC